jgi:hypothetical protein
MHDLTAPYRRKLTGREVDEALQQIADGNTAAHKANELARASAREARNTQRLHLFRAILPFVVTAAVLYGLWVFVAEPMIHYHSLSVACGAHQYNACQQLQLY